VSIRTDGEVIYHDHDPDEPLETAAELGAHIRCVQVARRLRREWEDSRT